MNLTKLKAVAGKLKKNHALALELWETGIHDARLLATYIADPKKVTEELADQWIQEVDFCDLSDNLSCNLISKTSFAYQKMKQWLESDCEYIRRSGYMLLSALAKKSKTMSDEEFEAYLEDIQANLQTSPNRVREMMNWSIIMIGSRNKSLNEKAISVAQRIGKVHVDYGDTSCKTPDAYSHLTKARLQEKFKQV